MENLTRTLKFVSEEGFFFPFQCDATDYWKQLQPNLSSEQDIPVAVLLPSPTQPQGAVAARP